MDRQIDRQLETQGNGWLLTFDEDHQVVSSEANEVVGL